MSHSPDRKLYLGPRLRVLRRELGLNQTQMAEELGISPSYLNHLERNQRPVTAQVLLRLTGTYNLDLREFVAGGSVASVTDLQEILSDRLVRDIGIPRHEVTEVAENHPSVTEAILRFYRALTGLRGVPDRLEQLGSPQHEGAAPVDWLRSAIEQRRNYFGGLDDACEVLSEELGGGPGDLAIAMETRLREKHGISTKIMPARTLVGVVRHYDFHRRRLMLSEDLPPSGRLFGLAYQLCVESLALPLAEAAEACAPPNAESAGLLKIALANYAAAAVLMPYGRFFQAAEQSRYDITLLTRRFGTSLEQVAHRLTTLDRPSHRGVPFFLLKLDVSGNVMKRYTVEQAPLPRFAGGCPRWDTQRAFQRIGEPVLSRVESVSGTRFYAAATALLATPDLPPSLLILGCQEKYGPKVQWADGLTDTPIPVGVACNVCVRLACPARSQPPLTRALDFQVFQKLSTAYPFRDA